MIRGAREELLTRGGGGGANGHFVRGPHGTESGTARSIVSRARFKSGNGRIGFGVMLVAGKFQRIFSNVEGHNK